MAFHSTIDSGHWVTTRHDYEDGLWKFYEHEKEIGRLSDIDQMKVRQGLAITVDRSEAKTGKYISSNIPNHDIRMKVARHALGKWETYTRNELNDEGGGRTLIYHDTYGLMLAERHGDGILIDVREKEFLQEIAWKLLMAGLRVQIVGENQFIRL